MNKQQALAKLRRLIGKNLGYREALNAPDAEGRAEAAEEFKTVRVQREAAQEAMEARRRELLEDPAYKALQANWQALKKRQEHLSGMAHWYRITVGRSSAAGGIGFFHVDAEGDNWADVVAAIESKRKETA